MEEDLAAREYLASVESQLATDECDPRWEDWEGMPVLVGRRADFRMVRWLGTRLHLFTVAAAVPEVTVPVLDAFTTQVLGYAKENKGGLPVGAQTGIAVFPVLVSGRVDPSAIGRAKEKQVVKFACVARPVVADTARCHVSFFRGKPAMGRIYASHLIEKGDRYFHHPGWEVA